LVLNRRYAAVPSDVASEKPSHYGAVSVKQNHYSNWSDAKQAVPDHYANVEV